MICRITISGPPGCGKTMIASNIIESLKLVEYSSYEYYQKGWKDSRYCVFKEPIKQNHFIITEKVPKP